MSNLKSLNAVEPSQNCLFLIFNGRSDLSLFVVLV